jgi:hypothetical protein
VLVPYAVTPTALVAMAAVRLTPQPWDLWNHLPSNLRSQPHQLLQHGQCASAATNCCNQCLLGLASGVTVMCTQVRVMTTNGSATCSSQMGNSVARDVPLAIAQDSDQPLSVQCWATSTQANSTLADNRVESIASIMLAELGLNDSL